jgi:hypothetical protein
MIRSEELMPLDITQLEIITNTSLKVNIGCKMFATTRFIKEIVLIAITSRKFIIEILCK